MRRVGMKNLGGGKYQPQDEVPNYVKEAGSCSAKRAYNHLLQKRAKELRAEGHTRREAFTLADKDLQQAMRG